MKHITALVVESDAELKSSLLEILKTQAVSCVEAGSVEEAIQALAKERVDLVITGLNLRYAKEGLHLIHEIREMYGRTIYVLAVSESSDEGLIRALLAGADAILRKPFHPGDVLRAVKFLHGKLEEVLV